MVKNWYKNWFGNDYLTVYSHRDEKEARQLIKLIQDHIHLGKKSKILDLCCGQGRHALLLSNAGFEVYGIDLSMTLLKDAKSKKAWGQSAYFILADMRNLPVSHSFDLLLNLFTSFGYFESDDENQSVFHQFHLALRQNGYFVFDYFNADHVIENLVPYQKEKIGNLVVEQERYIEGSRVQKKIKLNNNGRESIFYESVKMYPPDQILGMMKAANLHVLHLFGDYQGSPLKKCSPRMIVIGTKINEFSHEKNSKNQSLQ
jgi:SAM-dependent methyltransferase